MADDQENKTEEATPKRLQEAFERGQFARSPDIAVAAILIGALAVLMFQAKDTAQAIGALASHCFQNLARTELSSENLVLRTREALVDAFQLSLPFLIVSAVAAVLAGGLQTRFRLTPKVLELKLEKLNFVTGFQNVFSKQALMTLPFDILKLGAVGVALWLGIRSVMKDPIFYTPMDAAHLAQFLLQTTLTFLGWFCGAIVVIAAMSFGYQKIKVARDLRMTKEEVKQEMKSSEGDPLVKGHRRRLARRLMQKQMLEAVPTADVVVTNPTHYAVALKYERGKDAAPMVLAKGENRFALRIKAMAQEHGVPVVENKPLARTLYAMGKVGETIPSELYHTVAEILAFVYRTHRYYFHQLRHRRTAAEADRAA